MPEVVERSQLQKHQGEKFTGPVEVEDGKGMYFKYPVLTTAERDDRTDLAEGMIIHNSDLHVEQEWNGTKWCTLTDTKSVTFVVASVHSVETRASYVCDGEDDQVEIQVALDALPEQGGTVILLEGNYDITATINVPEKACLQGQGYGTYLDAHGAAIVNVITITGDDAAIRNLRIEVDAGAGTTNNRPTLIYSSSKKRIVIEGCYLKGDDSVANEWKATRQNGMYLSSCQETKVINCYIESNPYAGITINASDKCTVANCTVKDTGYYGIKVNSSARALITGNTCLENEVGICLISANQPTVTGNVCNENKRTGIWLERSIQNGTISGNNCNGNDYAGLEVSRSSQNNTVSGNSCCENAAGGIRISGGCHHNAFTGNVCRGNDTDGVKSYGDYNSFMSNVCTENELNGIWIRAGNKNLVMGNQLTGNYSGLPLKDEGTNTVSQTAAADKYNVEA